jgi:hypothetical protein
MKRPEYYRQYIKTPEWWQRRDQFFAVRFPGVPCCELQAHHLHYRTLGFEQPTDLVFVCDKCHRNLDRELAVREHELTTQLRVETRRREIRQFKHRFQEMCRRRGGSDPKRIWSLYRHFVAAWRLCCQPSWGASYRPMRDNQRWFLKIHRFMKREQGAFWFARIDFENAVDAYLAFLDQRRQGHEE